MMKKWFNAPASGVAAGFAIIRVGIALILGVHSVNRMIRGHVPDFGEFLESVGIPFPVAAAWLITLSTFAATVGLLTQRLVSIACAVHILVLVTGIVIIHYDHGWFVVGGGRNGMEYSVTLIICLTGIGWAYRPRLQPV